jgi:hypothetical protein
MANYRVSTNTYSNSKTTQGKETKKKTRTKENLSAKLFKLKHDLLKKSVDLHTAFAADTHLDKGQWLKEQLNVVKLRMFRVGTRRPTVSRTEGQ